MWYHIVLVLAATSGHITCWLVQLPGGRRPRPPVLSSLVHDSGVVAPPTGSMYRLTTTPARSYSSFRPPVLLPCCLCHHRLYLCLYYFLLISAANTSAPTCLHRFLHCLCCLPVSTSSLLPPLLSLLLTSIFPHCMTTAAATAFAAAAVTGTLPP
jgi:hypothetical protein